MIFVSLLQRKSADSTHEWCWWDLQPRGDISDSFNMSLALWLWKGFNYSEFCVWDFISLSVLTSDPLMQLSSAEGKRIRISFCSTRTTTQMCYYLVFSICKMWCIHFSQAVCKQRWTLFEPLFLKCNKFICKNVFSSFVVLRLVCLQ